MASDAVAAIYEALDDDEAYAALPATLAGFGGARSTVFQVFSPDGELKRVSWNYFSGEGMDHYASAELYRLDPWRANVARPDTRGRAIALDAGAVPVEGLVNTRFWNENIRQWGDDTGRCLGVGFELADGGSATIGLFRPIRAAPFATADEEWLQPLIQHVRRTVELRERLGEASAKAALSGAALDAQANAVFVLDASGLPQLMNRAAEALVVRQDGLALTPAGLRPSGAAAARALDVAIKSACARTGQHGGAVPLPRSLGPALRAVVSPLSAGHSTHALVVVNDPARVDPDAVETLRRFYGFSTAEAEIAIALRTGASTSTIAARRGVSLPTVRTQIRQALRKAEARGIPELVAFIASAPYSAGSDFDRP